MQAYPLQWPQGWPRTPAAKKKPGLFNTRSTKMYANGAMATYRSDISISSGVKRVLDELDKLIGTAGGDIVISTNLKTRPDGLPYSGQGEPQDSGVAIYWRDRGHMRVMAIDRYLRVADNLAAIAATLQAMRAIDRHGGAQILERAFTGFDTLPPSDNFDPWQVLGIARSCATPGTINNRFRESCPGLSSRPAGRQHGGFSETRTGQARSARPGGGHMKYGNWVIFYETKAAPAVTYSFVRACAPADALATAAKWPVEGLIIHGAISPEAATFLGME